MGLFEILNRVFPPRETTKPEPTERNAPCPCGSKRKYKVCHMTADRKKAKSRG